MNLFFYVFINKITLLHSLLQIFCKGKKMLLNYEFFCNNNII